MGLSLVLVSVLTLIAERLSGWWLSSQLARLWCADSYLRQIDGILSEQSCGFDADMYLAAACLLLLLVGVGMLISAQLTASRHRLKSHEKER
jgi:hypothetical protein